MNQIIYTSCKRGINGGSDGQQIYSYDGEFSKISPDELSEIKGFFSYQPPKLPLGISMSEEVAKTFPRNFTYKPTNEGRAAFSLRTYIGRDYMGASGRFGNHISHVIIGKPAEFETYPIDYFNSKSFRCEMSFEEVNSSERPDLLPAPSPARGNFVNFERISEFLTDSNNFIRFRSILQCLFSPEISQKRIVICSSQEEFVLFVAAISYVFPPLNTFNLSFSTYEYNPDLSPFMICRVLNEGSSYTFDEETCSRHFVFDSFNDYYPKNILGKDEKIQKVNDIFFDFLDAAFTFSEESLKEFINFVDNNYNYRKININIVSAYAMYCLQTGNFTDFDADFFSCAANFHDKYAKKQVALFNLIAEIKPVDISCTYAARIAEYIYKHSDFINAENDEMIFEYFAELFRISAEKASIISDGKDEKNSADEFERLCEIIARAFGHTALNSGEFFGKNHSILIDLCVDLLKQNPANFFEKCPSLLSGSFEIFSSEMRYSLVFALKAEKKLYATLLEIYGGHQENETNRLISKFSIFFGNFAARHYYNNRVELASNLLKRKKTIWLAAFYNALFSRSETILQTDKLFSELRTYFFENPEISGSAFDNYYRRLETAEEGDRIRKLSNYLIKNKIRVNFMKGYIEKRIEALPSTPTMGYAGVSGFENYSSLYGVYLTEVFGKKLSGKHAIFFMYPSDYGKITQKTLFRCVEKIPLGYFVNEKDARKYIASVFPLYLPDFNLEQSFSAFANLWDIPDVYAGFFAEDFLKTALKNDKSPTKLLEIFKFASNLPLNSQFAVAMKYVVANSYSKNKIEKILSPLVTKKYLFENSGASKLWADITSKR